MNYNDDALTPTMKLNSYAPAATDGAGGGTYSDVNKITKYAYSSDGKTWYKVEDGTKIVGISVTPINTDQRGYKFDIILYKVENLT